LLLCVLQQLVENDLRTISLANLAVGRGEERFPERRSAEQNTLLQSLDCLFVPPKVVQGPSDAKRRLIRHTSERRTKMNTRLTQEDQTGESLREVGLGRLEPEAALAAGND